MYFIYTITTNTGRGHMKIPGRLRLIAIITQRLLGQSEGYDANRGFNSAPATKSKDSKQLEFSRCC